MDLITDAKDERLIPGNVELLPSVDDGPIVAEKIWTLIESLRSMIAERDAAIKQGEIYQRIIEVDDSNEITRLRDELDAAIGAKEKAEGALCRAREWLATAKTLNGTECSYHDPHRKKYAIKERCGKCILCLIDYAITVHLSSSSPCPHEKLLSEQVDATNVVTKELNACYAELGIFRHPDQPERGPDAIKMMREELEDIKVAYRTECRRAGGPA